eukprot:2517638-Rhodomonas_salina.6
MRAAAREYGFFYVRNGPGQNEEARNAALEATKALFDLPHEQKLEMAATNSPLYRGVRSLRLMNRSACVWMSPHCGSYSHTCTPTEAAGPDQKESFTIGATGPYLPVHPLEHVRHQHRALSRVRFLHAWRQPGQTARPVASPARPFCAHAVSSMLLCVLLGSAVLHPAPRYCILRRFAVLISE